jgi:hypothetical protein
MKLYLMSVQSNQNCVHSHTLLSFFTPYCMLVRSFQLILLSRQMSETILSLFCVHRVYIYVTIILSPLDLREAKNRSHRLTRRKRS